MRWPRTWLAITVAALWAAPHARAQPAAAVDGFRAAELPEDGFVLSRPSKRGHLRPSARLSLSYLNDPLVFERNVGTAGSETTALVSDQVTATLAAGLDLFERAVVFASMPVHLMLKGEVLGTQPTATGFGPGDLGVGARFDLHATDDVSTSAQLSFTLPTGAGGEDGRAGVAGDAGVTVHPEILASVHLGPLWLHANVGMRWRRDVVVATARLSDALTYALGVSLPLADERVEVVGELFGRSPLDDFGDRADSPLEAMVGANLPLDGGFRAGAAGGLGITRGYGTPDLRLMANLGWTMPTRIAGGTPPSEPEPTREAPPKALRELEPTPPQPPPAPKPTAAPKPAPVPPAPKPPAPKPTPAPPPTPQPAPTPPPAAPAPAATAAPAAGAAAATIVAALASDPNGDHDRDGVANGSDECPIAPGPSGQQGCPDSHDVDLQAGRFELKKPFRFEDGSAALQSKTEGYLEEIVATLNANPKMRLRIEGHVAEGTDAAAAMSLTRGRAAAVRAWLTKHGVAATRLESWGCGQASPVAPNNVPWGRKRNERIELVLLDPAGANGVGSSQGCESVQ